VHERYIFVFCISNTFPVLNFNFVFQILFKICVCILYFKYKLQVFDSTLFICNSIYRPIISLSTDFIFDNINFINK